MAKWDFLAAELASSNVSEDCLNSFLVGAVEAWLRRRSVADELAPASWEGTFEDSAVAFVDQLIEDNQELFEELAKR